MFYTDAGFNAYKKYLALKRHFTGNYDYHKYNGKIKVGKSSYENRKDSLIFEKIAKLVKPEEVEEFFVSHLKEDASLYLTDMSRRKFEAYKDDMKVLPNLFRDDLEKLKYISKEMLISEKGKIPEIYKWSMGKKVRIESIICLDYVIPFLDEHGRSVNFILSFQDHYEHLLNYRPFVRHKLNSNYESILRKVYSI